MTLRFGEIVLIRMYFHQGPGSKIRPALVLLDAGDDDFVAAPVTSQPRTSEYDLVIAGWQAAGLNVASSVRVHKLTVLPKPDVIRSVGLLTEPDRRSLVELLCRAFCESGLKSGAD
jgi:mRNA interferase MazF